VRFGHLFLAPIASLLGWVLLGLDVVALTHAHQDHLGGLTAILENFRVAQLWIAREVSVPALARLEELARERRVPIEHDLSGKSFRWDGIEGEFLWPEIVSGAVALPQKITIPWCCDYATAMKQCCCRETPKNK